MTDCCGRPATRQRRRAQHRDARLQALDDLRGWSRCPRRRRRPRRSGPSLRAGRAASSSAARRSTRLEGAPERLRPGCRSARSANSRAAGALEQRAHLVDLAPPPSTTAPRRSRPSAGSSSRGPRRRVAAAPRGSSCARHRGARSARARRDAGPGRRRISTISLRRMSETCSRSGAATRSTWEARSVGAGVVSMPSDAVRGGVLFIPGSTASALVAASQTPLRVVMTIPYV